MYPTGKVALFAVAHLPVLCHPRKNILHIELHTTLPAERKKEEADFSASSRKSLDFKGFILLEVALQRVLTSYISFASA